MRPVYSLAAAAWALAAVLLMIAALWITSGWLADLSILFNHRLPWTTRAAAWLANIFDIRRGFWLASLGAAAFYGFLEPHGHRPQRPRAAAHKIIALLLWTLTLVLFTAAALLSPLLNFTRGLHPKPDPFGQIPCASWASIYVSIAHDQQVGDDLNTALEIANDSAVTDCDFPGVGTLHVVAPDFHGELRGAQGNGPYVVVLEDASGALAIVSPPDLGGNQFDFDGRQFLTTSWHDGGGQFDVCTYRWNGHTFQLVSQKTETPVETDDTQPSDTHPTP